MLGTHRSCQQRTSTGATRYEGTHAHRWPVEGPKGTVYDAAFDEYAAFDDDDDDVPQSGEGMGEGTLDDAEWLSPECVSVTSPEALFGGGGDVVYATTVVQVDCLD